VRRGANFSFSNFDLRTSEKSNRETRGPKIEVRKSKLEIEEKAGNFFGIPEFVPKIGVKKWHIFLMRRIRGEIHKPLARCRFRNSRSCQ